MFNVKVEPIVSNRSGRAVCNQYSITAKDGVYFQSYESLCAKIDNEGVLTLGRDWDYSVTTGKYLHQWLRDNHKSNIANMSKKNIQRAIDKGEIRYNEKMI